jgi:hypothetical protein
LRRSGASDTVRFMAAPKRRYVATYIQECTQPITAETIEGAGLFARQYARSNGLRLLQIHDAEPAPVDKGTEDL